MDKQALRKQIREQKRAMTPEQIETASARLGDLFLRSEPYRQAKTIYGYLPYNQEVRTVPMLEQAIRDGKRVAVPKVYGEEMRFIYIDDFTRVEKGYAGIYVYADQYLNPWSLGENEFEIWYRGACITATATVVESPVESIRVLPGSYEYTEGDTMAGHWMSCRKSDQSEGSM